MNDVGRFILAAALVGVAAMAVAIGNIAVTSLGFGFGFVAYFLAGVAFVASTKVEL